MGTECISPTVKEDSDGMPSVPPGFSSFAVLALKSVRIDPKVSPCVSSSVQSENDTPCSTSGSEKCRKSLRHRPPVDYSHFDHISGEESDFERNEKDGSSVRCRLPKGVLRGCAECINCQKVIAKWNPDGARRPALDEAPVFHPTEEEFKDTLKYIASIRPFAEPYGICRIVPPSSWKPPCLLKEKSLWENSKFATRVQQVDKLQNRNSMKKNSRNQPMMMRKRRKLSETGEDTSISSQGLHQNSERFGFEPGPDFTLETFQKYADDFINQYFRTETSTDSKPSMEQIEGEYWRIVERPTEHIEVIYGADLETGTFGSGFPKSFPSETSSEIDDRYAKSGWNLNNLPRLEGSVLCYEGGDISGVVVPWLYIGMCFSSFCWHVEDHHLYSLNYLHWGAPKTWYGVPGKDAVKLEAAMKKHLPDLFEEQPDLLHNLVTQFSPSLLKSEGVPVYRCVQREGEFVLTFPRAYHSGFNSGFNCAEAVNVAPIDWLPHGQTAVELYREQHRKISISHDKLLLGAGRDAVKAQWDILFLKKNTPDNLRWKSVCGLDGVLSKALKVRIQTELAQREHICPSFEARKMDASFDASDRECAICHYDIHLSATGCRCCPEKFTCVLHANQLCSCASTDRFFLFRYEISELNMLADALGGKLSAIHRWGKSDLRLSLNAYVKKEKAQDTKTTIRASKEGHVKCQEISVGTSNDSARKHPSQEPKSSMLHPSSCDDRKDRENRLRNSANEQANMNWSSVDQIKPVNISASKEPFAFGKSLCHEEMRGSFQSSCVPGGNNSSNLIHPSVHLPSSRVAASPFTTSSEPFAFTQERKLYSGIGDRNSPCSEFYSRSPMLLDKETKAEPVLESSKPSYRFPATDNNGTIPNAYRDQVLVTPETSAFVKNEKDSRSLSQPSSQQLVRAVPQSASNDTSSTIVSSLRPMTNMFTVKEAHGSVSLSRGDLVRPLNFGNEKPNSECIQRKTESVPGCEVRTRGNLVVAEQSYTQNASNRGSSLQKGPRIASVVHRFKCCVEPLQYGAAISGKLWSSNQSIFPKGYKSRVKYLSIIDPTQMCYYVSEILDAGLQGPLFMVTLEQCPSEAFIHVSPARCWSMVRERLNLEIRRHQSMGKIKLPPLQPPGSIVGLEMFGLLSPSIIQAIEALDRNHVCTEYWRSRPHFAVTPTTATAIMEGQGNQHCSQLCHPLVILRGLFQRANQEELQALRSILTNNTPDNSRQELTLLIEAIEKRR